MNYILLFMTFVKYNPLHRLVKLLTNIAYILYLLKLSSKLKEKQL